jgi:hypothetical protein
MKSFQFKDLMVNVAPAGERAQFCGFGATCNYGTYCGWITPCGFTCDVGRTCAPYSITHTVLQEQARVVAPARGGCGFGYTCNYGTYCGWSIEPCGYTCDYGNTHPTRPFFEEQARAAAPAGAQAGAGAGAGAAAAGGGAGALCAVHTFCPFFTCHFGTCYNFSPCRLLTCQIGCSVAITDICRAGPTILPCQVGTCGFTIDPTPTIQVDPEGVKNQLAAVKAQLQQELAAIEKQEQAVAEALRPQTTADIEELQGKLREAITELDKQKQELHKKSEKPSKK